jgi:hypothetical protein
MYIDHNSLMYGVFVGMLTGMLLMVMTIKVCNIDYE